MESCSYSPPTYCICLYHRNSYHLIFTIFKRWNLIFGVCPIKSHTAGTVRAWAALLPRHNTGWMSLEHTADWKWVQVGVKKPTFTAFWAGKTVKKPWVATVWGGLCLHPCWISVLLQAVVQTEGCRQPPPALRELHGSHVLCPSVHWGCAWPKPRK